MNRRAEDCSRAAMRSRGLGCSFIVGEHIREPPELNLSRNDAIGRAVPLTQALSPRRTGHRFRLEEPFGVYNRGRVWEAKRGRRCALPPHSIELN